MLTPVQSGDVRQSGATLWRKQLLPVGEIDYKGRKIAFTREYLGGLVKAFRDRAYDFVPFQLADAANTHTNDPERTRGQVTGLELTPDGLDVIVSTTPKGAAVLSENPALGISARIVEDYARSDGRHFPAAVQHVLGTLDPRIPGMRPWQAVEAANDDDGEVIDLTDHDYDADEKGDEMAFTDEQQKRLDQLLGLPEDKFAALVGGEDTTEGDDDGQLTDEELDQLLASLGDDTDAKPEGDDEDETADEGELVGAALSNEAQAAIDLANARADENATALKVMRVQLDGAAYERERDDLARSFGIPPRITDLARPLLEGSGHAVELANGKSADAGAVIREVLKEFGRTVKALDLSTEAGSAFGADIEAADDKARSDERDKVIGALKSMTGVR
jgi:hypothetical protein